MIVIWLLLPDQLYRGWSVSGKTVFDLSMIFLNSHTIPDLFGRRYKLHLRGEAMAPRALEAERFTGEDEAVRFRRLDTGPGFWRRFIASCDELSQPMKMSDRDIEARVGRLLAGGRIRLFRVSEPDPERSPPARRRVPGENGVRYRFESASALLTGRIGEAMSVRSRGEAEQFIESLNIDDEHLTQIAADLEVPATGTHNPAGTRRALAEALHREQIVVDVERPQSAPPKSPAAASVPAAGPGMVEAGLGPAAAGAVAEIAEADEPDPPCDLQRFTVQCGHGRTAEILPGAARKPHLAVVATESQSQGRERITAQIHGGALCPRHKNDDFSISREHKASTKAEKKVVFDAYCAEWSVDNMFERVWLPAVRPKTYTVRAKDTCESPDIEIFDIDVDVYPKMKWHWETTVNFGKLEFIPGKAKVQYSDLAIDGNVQLTYDGEPYDGKEKFDRYIRKPLEGFQNICDAISKVLEVINNPESLMRIGTRAAAPPPPEGQDNRDGNETKLEIQWPILTLDYDSELLENSDPGLVDHDYSISLKADPLLDVDLQVDVLDVFMKMAPAGTSALISYAKERVEEGFESKNAKFRGEIDLIFTAAMRVDINQGALSGMHNIEEHDLSGDPIKGEINIPVSLEGVIRAEGKWFVVSFKINYELRGEAGWNGRYEIGKDEDGVYFSQSFWFTGIVVTFTKYEEVKGELEVEAYKDAEVSVDDIYGAENIKVSSESGDQDASIGMEDGNVKGSASYKEEYERAWSWLQPDGEPGEDQMEKYYILRS